MWSPVSLRIFDSWTDLVALAGARPRARPRRAAGAARAAAGAAAGAAARAPGPGAAGGRSRRRCGRSGRGGRRGRRRRCSSMWSSTSSRVMRPPVPGARDRGRVEAVLGDQTAHDRRQQPVVAARRGLDRRRAAGRPRAGGAGARAAAGAERAAGAGPAAGPVGRGDRLGRGRRLGCGAAAGAGAPARDGSASAGSPVRRPGLGGAGAAERRAGRRRRRHRRRPRRSPRRPATVSPSLTRISTTVPAMGDGTSVSTLSVDTSNSGSSTRDRVADRLNHFVIVPSVTVSPSWGMVTSAIRRAGSFR